MSFIFKLHALLELRRQTEKQHQRAVAQIQQEINRLNKQIHNTQIAIHKQNRALAADKLIGRLDLTYIANEKRFVGNLQLLMVQTMQKLANVEKDLAAARAKLLEAAKERKVIEKLHNKQFARWKQAQDRKEYAILDELGTQVALRGMAEEEFLVR